jgi:hypothetical protein
MTSTTEPNIALDSYFSWYVRPSAVPMISIRAEKCSPTQCR